MFVWKNGWMDGLIVYFIFNLVIQDMMTNVLKKIVRTENIAQYATIGKRNTIKIKLTIHV